MASVKSVGTDVFEPPEDSRELLEDMEEEGARPASMSDIFRFGRPEWPMAIAGLMLSVIRGSAWPIFSVIYGRMFLTLSTYTAGVEGGGSSSAFDSNWHNAMAYVALGLMACVSTFGSGSLLSTVGEKLTLRLRLAVFKVTTFITIGTRLSFTYLSKQ